MLCLTYIMLLCCSQRQHQFSSGTMGILRSVGAGCHVPGPGLLSQALLWSSASRLAAPDLTISSVTILHPCFCTSFVCSFWVIVCWAFVCLGMGVLFHYVVVLSWGGSVPLCCCFEWVFCYGGGELPPKRFLCMGRGKGYNFVLDFSLVAVQLAHIYISFFMVEFWWFLYNTFIVSTYMNRLVQYSVVLCIKQTYTYSDRYIGLEGGGYILYFHLARIVLCADTSDISF